MCIRDSFDTSAIMGLRRPDKTVVLNPPMDTVIGAEDRIIAISEDDDTVVMHSLDDWKPGNEPARTPDAPQKPERTLVLGWNQMGPRIIQELDKYVAPGSVVD